MWKKHLTCVYVFGCCDLCDGCARGMESERTNGRNWRTDFFEKICFCSGPVYVHPDLVKLQLCSHRGLWNHLMPSGLEQLPNETA